MRRIWLGVLALGLAQLGCGGEEMGSLTQELTTVPTWTAAVWNEARNAGWEAGKLGKPGSWSSAESFAASSL